MQDILEAKYPCTDQTRSPTPTSLPNPGLTPTPDPNPLTPNHTVPTQAVQDILEAKYPCTDQDNITLGALQVRQAHRSDSFNEFVILRMG